MNENKGERKIANESDYELIPGKKGKRRWHKKVAPPANKNVDPTSFGSATQDFAYQEIKDKVASWSDIKVLDFASDCEEEQRVLGHDFDSIISDAKSGKHVDLEDVKDLRKEVIDLMTSAHKHEEAIRKREIDNKGFLKVIHQGVDSMISGEKSALDRGTDQLFSTVTKLSNMNLDLMRLEENLNNPKGISMPTYHGLFAPDVTAVASNDREKK